MHPMGEGEAAQGCQGGVLILGNFDGVHLGHQGALRFARGQAQALGLPVGVLVFEPHPRQFFAPQAPPFRLQSRQQRLRALAEHGLDAVVELKFDHEFAAQTPQAFAETVLQQRFRAHTVIVGPDFRFGAGRQGNVANLTDLGRRLSFSVLTAPLLAEGAEKISSSRIRAALQAGEMAQAQRWLGRPWAIEGLVVRGAQRGRSIGFPTANVAMGAYQRPAFGVYAVKIRIAGGPALLGVANLGFKPTVALDQEPLLEAHIFDFSGDIYGRGIEVELVRYLRTEQRFESFNALKEQIARDARAARMLLAAPGLEEGTQ